METTKLSTKGQLILPKSIRTAKAWGPGTQFTVEEAGDGVLLRPDRPFPKSRLAEVAGSLRPLRPRTRTLDEKAAIERKVKERRDRGRY